jgi:2-oxoglutarate ferredoxin oxidoreductase subunit alpha
LLPATPKEAFEMTALAFDLTEKLQSPIIVMTDLDLGMNDHVTEPLEWDDTRPYNRGKVLTSEQLESIYASPSNGNGRGDLPKFENNIDAESPPEQGRHEAAGAELEQFRGKWGRYLDIDDDGIPYRTIPGTDPTRGAFVTRGSSRDEYGVYTEDADAYRRNVDRLLRKWDTAKELVPGPQFYQEGNRSGDGVIFFGTSIFAAEEAIDMLAEQGIQLDAMRPLALPFGRAFRDFVDAHERVFVIEQNRDAQFRSAMMIELDAEPSKLISVLSYDGMPITADNIFRQIKRQIEHVE